MQQKGSPHVKTEDKKESEKEDDRKQGNMYDKVFKETMLGTHPVIIECVLRLNIITIEELKDDIQYTKERKTDLLKKVCDVYGNTYILHIEYQTDNYPKMQFRMADYSIMLQRKYSLPVLQFVIYLGPGEPDMPTTIDSKDLQFRYNLTALSSVDHSLFLKSEKLEERMLAILGKMEQKESIPVLEKVLTDIKETAKDSLSTDRYVQQLHVLVKLRNLGQNLQEVMMTIAKFFKEEEDLLYRLGQEKGEHKKAVATAIEMLLDDAPLALITKYTKLSTEEIQALAQENRL